MVDDKVVLELHTDVHGYNQVGKSSPLVYLVLTR